MQLSRNHLFLILNVAVLFACVALLLPDGNLQQLGLVAIAMGLSLLAPYLIINKSNAEQDKQLAFNEKELSATKEQLVEAQRKLQEAATLDDLTGAYNKRHFESLISQHCGIATRGNYVFSICSTRIDHFDKLVEKYGRIKGDEVLRLFVSVARSALREVDFIARLDGEKFGLMLSGASEESAILAVNRMAGLIQQIHVSDDDPEFRLTTSAGLTEFRKEVAVENMLADADEALGFATNEGGHRVAAHIHAEVANS